MDDGTGVSEGERVRHTRRWLRLAAEIALVAGLFVVVVVFTGIPGVRPSLRRANALVDKINTEGCRPDAAHVDWVSGMVDTVGEPSNIDQALTPDERELLRVNGKVGLVCGSIS